MRHWLVLGVMGLLVISTAWAGTGTTAGEPTSAARTPARLTQQLIQHEVALGQLRQEVGQQQADGKQAEARLQQQDQTIAELQQQLQAIRTKAAVDHP